MVEKVLYPRLKSHPGHEIATSLGNVDSLIQHSASMTHASMSREEREAVGIADVQVRLSVGIEEAEEIIKDLDQALNFVKKELNFYSVVPKTRRLEVDS